VLSTDLSSFLLYRSPYVDASRSAGVTTGSEKSCPFGLATTGLFSSLVFDFV
jgi:hypothetical protein